MNIGRSKIVIMENVVIHIGDVENAGVASNVSDPGRKQTL